MAEEKDERAIVVCDTCWVHEIHEDMLRAGGWERRARNVQVKQSTRWLVGANRDTLMHGCMGGTMNVLQQGLINQSNSLIYTDAFKPKVTIMNILHAPENSLNPNLKSKHPITNLNMPLRICT